MRGISDLIRALYLLLPHWAAAGLVGMCVAMVLPFWIDSMRQKQIRGAIRRRARATGADRGVIAEEALRLAGHRSGRLITLIAAAEKMGQLDLRARGVARLSTIWPQEAARLAQQVKPETKPPGHPLEVAVVVRRLWQEGAEVAARTRLAEGLARFPRDPDLRALRDELERPDG